LFLFIFRLTSFTYFVISDIYLLHYLCCVVGMRSDSGFAATGMAFKAQQARTAGGACILTHIYTCKWQFCICFANMPAQPAATFFHSLLAVNYAAGGKVSMDTWPAVWQPGLG
jgi:hypothetical protein